jgi:hypothetical protein
VSQGGEGVGEVRLVAGSKGGGNVGGLIAPDVLVVGAASGGHDGKKGNESMGLRAQSSKRAGAQRELRLCLCALDVTLLGGSKAASRVQKTMSWFASSLRCWLFRRLT